MLAKSPADRFATPAEVAAALEPFCEDAALPALIANAIALPPEQWAKAEKSEDANFITPRPATAPKRRRPIVRNLLLGMGFLGAMALGVAAGVIITIKINGETHKLNVPNNSETDIDEHGNATVRLDGNPVSQERQSAQESNESAVRFAPEIEKVINAKGEGKGSDALDLTDNKLFDLPQDYNNWPVPKQEQWLKENNIDLLVDFEKEQPAGDSAGTGALLPKGLKFVAIARRLWENATREELRLAVKRVTAAMISDPDNTSSELVIANVREKAALPHTCCEIKSLVILHGPLPFRPARAILAFFR